MAKFLHILLVAAMLVCPYQCMSAPVAGSVQAEPTAEPAPSCCGHCHYQETVADRQPDEKQGPETPQPRPDDCHCQCLCKGAVCSEPVSLPPVDVPLSTIKFSVDEFQGRLPVSGRLSLAAREPAAADALSGREVRLALESLLA